MKHVAIICILFVFLGEAHARNTPNITVVYEEPKGVFMRYYEMISHLGCPLQYWLAHPTILHHPMPECFDRIANVYVVLSKDPAIRLAKQPYAEGAYIVIWVAHWGANWPLGIGYTFEDKEKLPS